MSYPSYRTAFPLEPAFQLGRMATPARVTRCGWPTDEGKTTLGGLVLLSDPVTRSTITALEAKVAAQHPGCELNSTFTSTIEDSDGAQIPVVRLKFSKRADALMVVQYGIVGDVDPIRGPPADMAGLRNGHLIVARITPKAWKHEGRCGVTLYANKVNCLGFQEAGPGAWMPEDSPSWE